VGEEALYYTYPSCTKMVETRKLGSGQDMCVVQGTASEQLGSYVNGQWQC